MKATGIIRSECCDKPVVNVVDERGTCCYCGKECWVYDTGLAQPLTLAELTRGAAKDELSDDQIQESINNLT